MPPILFPQRATPAVVLTPKMLDAQHRLFAVHHPRGQMMVLTGEAGAGKSTAALNLVDLINQASAAGEPNAFRAAYYVASDLRKPMHADLLQRRVFTEFAQQVLRLIVPKDMRTVSIPLTLTTIAAGLRLTDIQMVFIDEAGHIPPKGLDHLVTLINTVATRESHPLTVVLVGMDDLPINVRVMPQVSRRVMDQVFFAPYDADTALNVLRVVHPYFATVNPKTTEGQALMEFLLSPAVSHGGLIGYLVPLVERAAEWAVKIGMEFGPRALRMAHAITEEESALGQAASKRAWVAKAVQARPKTLDKTLEKTPAKTRTKASAVAPTRAVV